MYGACVDGDESTVYQLIAEVSDINWKNPNDDVCYKFG